MGDVKACPVCHREYPEGATHCADDGVPLVGLTMETTGRSEDLVGKIVEGRYKIERIIGKGGMGTVYACRHAVVGKIAAMKVLRAGGDRTDGVLQRFVREAQMANMLRSRHIVECSDFGQLPNGAFFVVMELLEGRDLARAMRDGLSRAELVHVFQQVAETLQIAHDKGIVHRDLKPDNVFLVNEAGDPLFVKLLDFGIAKIVHGESNAGLTETGVILGTPYYMSPEQARAEALDHRSDIYSLGVMMYRAFAGRLPFVADSTMGVLTRHITDEPEPPSKLAAMDQVTERLILRCLAKRPEHRFQSMRELMEALRYVPTGPVPAIREQTTVFDGRMLTGPSGAVSPASYAAATGAHARPPGHVSGAFSGPSAPPGHVSGAFSGPSAPPGHVSGAFSGPSAPPGHVSGAFSAPGAPPGFPGGVDPRLSGAPSGGFPAAPRAEVYPTGPGATGGVTTSGLAATGAAYPPPRASNNAAVIVLGAIAMLSLGALGAILLYRSRPDVAAAPPPLPAASATATASAAPPPPPTATASAEVSAAPTVSATATPTLRPRTGPLPKAAPATTATATKRTPREIRSPFD